jgi:thioredoxin reductase (NADPH)
MKNKVELAIIGAGIAGVAAAVYAKRSGLDFCLFEPQIIGGQLLFMEDIDNYIGLGMGTKGRDLAAILGKTLVDLEIEVINKEITKVLVEDKNIKLHTSSSQLVAKAAIIATGASFKKLGVKGENEFLGKGVSYCAVCDGFFFRKKEVAVIGGGNSAVEEALYLSGIANKVFLIHRRDKLRALDYLQKEIFKKDNIEVLFNSTIKEINGEGILKELIIADTQSNQTKKLAVDGLFVAIGVKPNTTIFNTIVSRDEAGFILSDEGMQSSCGFIWAAGDCRKRPLRQLITAASEGAIAAVSAYKYLKGHYIST